MSDKLKTELTEIIGADTYDGIQNALFQGEYNVEHGKWDDDVCSAFRQKLAELNIKIENEDQHGGEGEGDQYWNVYRFSRGDEEVFAKFDGSYASYCGSEFYEWYFCEKTPQQIFVYPKA